MTLPEPSCGSSKSSLPPELVRKAELELMEKPSWRDRDIQALREMVLDDPDLNSRTDDAFLLRFLRARKFDYDRAFSLLRQYYSQRIRYPLLYRDLLPSSVLHALGANLQGFLPHRDHQGRAIYVMNTMELWNPSKVSLEDLMRASLLSLERIIEEQDVQINGMVCILDCKGMGLHHIRHISPSKAKQYISITQDSFPARFKEVHFINEPAIFDIAYAIGKPFLNQKLKSRFFFHGTNLSSLHEHLSPEILPQEFGGFLEPFNNSEWTQTLLDHEETLKQNLKYGFLSEQRPNNELKRNDPFDFFVSYRRVCIH